MNDKTKYLVKNTTILTVSNFATKILTVLLIPLYTGVLTTSEYGVYDLVVTSVSLIFPILTLNIIDAIMRFSLDNHCSKDDIGKIGFRYVLVSTGIVSGALAVIYCFHLIPAVRNYCIYIFLYYLTTAMNSFLMQFAKGCEKVKEIGIAGVIGTIMTISLNILFLLVIQLGLPGFFLATILSQMTVCLYYMMSLRFFERIKKGHYDKALEREMLLYCLPLVVTTIGWWVNSASDKYVVTFFCGVAANGLLSISYKIPTILTTLQNIFIQAWQISAVKEYGNEKTATFYGRIFSFVNFMMCASCAWLIVLTKLLAHFLYAKDFYAAWAYVPFLLISTVFNCSSGLLGPILSAKKDSKSMAMSAVYGAGANLIMNVLFVWLMGIQGATIATVISSFIIYFVRKKAVGQEIIIDRYQVILITWALLCVQAVIEIYTPFWWLEAGLMGVMLYLNWGQMMNLIRMGRNVLKSRKVNEKSTGENATL